MEKNLILNQEKLIRPSNWYLSTPSLSKGTYFHDIVGGRKATLRNATWKNFNNKPGALSACLTTVGSSAPASIDLTLIRYNGITLSFWVKVNSFVNGSLLFYSDLIRLYVNTSGQLVFGSSHGGSSTSTNAISLDTWYHITVVNQISYATNHYIYVNGVNWITNTNFYTHSSIQIIALCNYGNNGGGAGTQLYGDVDDIMVFDQILSGNQIKEHYKNAFQRKYRYRLWQSSCASDICTMMLGSQF
jgi:hypothetical protein